MKQTRVSYVADVHCSRCTPESTTLLVLQSTLKCHFFTKVSLSQSSTATPVSV